MSINLRSSDWLHSHVPVHMHNCFTAVGGLDVQHLDYTKLESLMHEAWGIDLA